MLKLLPLILSNIVRKRMRAGLTLLSVIVAFVLFGVLAAAWQGFSIGVKNGSAELVVFNRTSRFHGLPLSDKNRIATIQGVRGISYIIWFGGYFQDVKNQLAGFAVDAPTYFSVDHFLHVPAAQLARWKKDRTGVIVGADTARRYGWKIGDRVPVKTSGWRNASGGDAWIFTVDGIGQSTSAGNPAAGFLLHYEYLNQSLPAQIQGSVSAFLVRIANSQQAARISNQIDDMFASSSAPTRTNTTNAVAQGFADQFANLGAIVLAIGLAVFVSLLLIVGNVHAQSVRERLSELATLRALGYARPRVVALVTNEALLTMLAGAAIGLGIAKRLAPALRQMVQAFLPGFYLPGSSMGLGLLLALLMALITAATPAAQAARLDVAPALRRG